jgi:hypothetical protein
MKNEYHYVDPEHLSKMQEKFAHLNLSDKFMLMILRYPFFFLAQRIEQNTTQVVYFDNLCKFQMKPKIRKEMNLFQTIRAIYDGNRNLVYKNSDVEALAAQRLSICRECPLYSRFNDTQGGDGTEGTTFHEYCNSNKSVTITSEGKSKTYRGCGCPLATKTRSPHDTCPMGKWKKASIHVDNTADIRNTEDTINWQNRDNETSV